MAPVVHGLEQKYMGRIGFVYIDISDERGDWLKSELGYRVQPHLILLDTNGAIVGEWVGATTEETLTLALEESLTDGGIP